MLSFVVSFSLFLSSDTAVKSVKLDDVKFLEIKLLPVLGCYDVNIHQVAPDLKCVGIE